MAWLKDALLRLIGFNREPELVSLGLGNVSPNGGPDALPTIWDRMAEPRVIVPHHANAPGPFYSENDGCISCGAPNAEAPDLLGWYEERCGAHTYSHCIFRRQPSTPAEVEQAIRAMDVSCVENLRYGGTDPVVLERLRVMGMAHLCDITQRSEPTPGKRPVPPEPQPN
jgi:hypothetical protein